MTVFVTPEPDSRLAALAAQYDLAKVELDKAAETFEAIKAGIKHELANAAEGATDIVLQTDALARPLQLQAVESWRVDATKLKREAPETYVRYAKKSTSWRLATVAVQS